MVSAGSSGGEGPVKPVRNQEPVGTQALCKGAAALQLQSFAVLWEYGPSLVRSLNSLRKARHIDFYVAIS